MSFHNPNRKQFKLLQLPPLTTVTWWGSSCRCCSPSGFSCSCRFSCLWKSYGFWCLLAFEVQINSRQIQALIDLFNDHFKHFIDIFSSFCIRLDMRNVKASCISFSFLFTDKLQRLSCFVSHQNQTHIIWCYLFDKLINYLNTMIKGIPVCHIIHNDDPLTFPKLWCAESR